MAFFPSDEEINNLGVRGIYIGNYVKWNGLSNYKLAKNLVLKFRKKFQRTYRQYSNIDDRYENGLHDYLKFIKFGYGRATDHASRDIRNGLMTRNQGIKMVKKYDSVIPDDLYYWLKYVNISEKLFWKHCDKIRDPEFGKRKIKNGLKKYLGPRIIFLNMKKIGIF